jgi:hypothetical protein
MGLRSGMAIVDRVLTLLNRRSDWADRPLAIKAATPMNTPSMGKVERISLRKIAGLLPPLLLWQKLRLLIAAASAWSGCKPVGHRVFAGADAVMTTSASII